MEWNKTRGFHISDVFHTVPFIPFQPLQWTHPPIAAPTSPLRCVCIRVSAWSHQTKCRAGVPEVKLNPCCSYRHLKVITIKWKPMTVNVPRLLNSRYSSKRSLGASFAYQFVKYCPWHWPVINALNQFWFTSHWLVLLGCRHYLKWWSQMHRAERNVPTTSLFILISNISFPSSVSVQSKSHCGAVLI